MDEYHDNTRYTEVGSINIIIGGLCMKKLFCSLILAFGMLFATAPVTAHAQGYSVKDNQQYCDGNCPRQGTGQQRQRMGRMGNGNGQQQRARMMNQSQIQNNTSADSSDINNLMQRPCWQIRNNNYQMNQNDFLTNCIRLNSNNLMNQ